LDLALRVLPSEADARARYLSRWSPHWSAFAEGWAGARRVGGQWMPDFGAAVGLRGEW